nr:MAG TPA: hypothetical protein [Caudoviricetes sp.]
MNLCKKGVINFKLIANGFLPRNWIEYWKQYGECK